MARKKQTHKLSPEAQRLLITRIIAGDSHAQILAALEQAGHPSDLDYSSVWYYRNHPQVQQALAQLDVEAMQTGLMHRSRRMLVFADSLQRLHAEMVAHLARTLPEQQNAKKPVGPAYGVVGELVQLMLDVSERLDQMQGYGQAGTPGRPLPTLMPAAERLHALPPGPQEAAAGFYEGAMTDLLEQYVREKQGLSEGDADHPTDP